MALYGGERMRGGCVIGVDLGGTKLLAGVVDGDLRVHHRTRRLALGLDQPTLLDTAVEAVREAVGASAQEVSAVGFGIPALIDPADGRVTFSTHLPLEGLRVGEVLSRRLGLAVHVDNDANLALLAEHRHGAARGARNALLLTLGTGIGGAILLDGRLHRGRRGAAGELGHIVVDEDGPPCQGKCPNRGCLEVMASGTALVREAGLFARQRPDSALGRAFAEERPLVGPLVTELAVAGDEAAREVIALIGRRLGAGVSGLVNAFDPDVVVIGGGVVGAGELLLGPARDEVARRALPPVHGTPLVAAHFGEDAGMLGAAVLAREALAAGASV
jgi:glucokinase